MACSKTDLKRLSIEQNVTLCSDFNLRDRHCNVIALINKQRPGGTVQREVTKLSCTCT